MMEIVGNRVCELLTGCVLLTRLKPQTHWKLKIPSRSLPTPTCLWGWEWWQSLSPLWVQMLTECAGNAHYSSPPPPQIFTSWRLVPYRVLLPRLANPVSLIHTNLPSSHGFSIRGQRPPTLRFSVRLSLCTWSQANPKAVQGLGK